MRQNRDIARVNSTQSLRIRNLENETSKLLADNLSLREQILRLQAQLEEGRAQVIADHTRELKAQLEVKILEIAALVNNLGDVDTRRKRPSKDVTKSATSSPTQKNWRSSCSLADTLASQEGRLPPILENKSYPRRTLEYIPHASLFVFICLRCPRSQDIFNIVDEVEEDVTDSPELGPPPVSQFVDEDPVKIDFATRSRKENNDEPTSLDPTLSINLEQRRKRRDSSTISDVKRSERSELQGGREAAGSLRTGAKRKLSVRDDDEPEGLSKSHPASPDDFKFTRVVNEGKSKTKTLSQPEKLSTKFSKDLAIARGGPREKQSAITVSTERRVLAPKSVNNSPRKNTKAFVAGDSKASKPDSRKSSLLKDSGRDRKQGQIETVIDILADTIEVQPEPETPVSLDLFSPSSQPSTAREESQDTPPPPDLGPGGEGQRPSRRARGAVSYAEPNLRDKMRRPTKELVDAVLKDGKSAKDGTLRVEQSTQPCVTIKTEPEAEDSWKHMPTASSSTVENSPLRSKASLSETLPTSITTHRKRRESLLNQTELEALRPGSGGAIAALLAETRKVKAEASLSTAMEKLDIYEFTGSSPDQSKAALNTMKEEKAPARFSKRQSSVTRDIVPHDDSEASDMEAPKPLTTLNSRRRQSTLGIRSSSSATSINVPPKEDETEKTLKKSASVAETMDLEIQGSRHERVAARRRSMML
jgi:hypothetical protein